MIASEHPPEAGFGEAVILIMCCWCTVLAAGLIAPVLPTMQAYFHAVPHADFLVGLVATAPALVVALLAIPLGILFDSKSIKSILLAGLLIYGVAGILPIWLDSLPQIIAARAAAGLGEGATMTASTVLLARRLSGVRRDRWLSIQVSVANMLGVPIIFIGGILGMSGWKGPFLGYLFGLALLLPAAFLICEPVKSIEEPGRTGDHLPWKKILTFCGFNMLVTMAIFGIILQLGFLLVERGSTNSLSIGFGTAIGAAGVAAGAALSSRFAHQDWSWRVGFGLLAAASGFLALSLSSGYNETIISAAVAGAGAGFSLPALLAAMVAQVAPGQIGRALGMWTIANFLGQFSAPSLFILLSAGLKGLPAAYGAFGLLCLVFASWVWFGMRPRPA